VQTIDHDLDGDNVANDESSEGSQRSSSDIISKFKTFSDTKKVLSINKCTSLNTAMKYLANYSSLVVKVLQMVVGVPIV